MSSTRKPRTQSVDETARQLKISRASAYRAVAAGEIPSLRIGRRILVLAEPLEQMLNGSTSRHPANGVTAPDHATGGGE